MTMCGPRVGGFTDRIAGHPPILTDADPVGTSNPTQQDAGSWSHVSRKRAQDGEAVDDRPRVAARLLALEHIVL